MINEIRSSGGQVAQMPKTSPMPREDSPAQGDTVTLGEPGAKKEECSPGRRTLKAILGGGIAGTLTAVGASVGASIGLSSGMTAGLAIGGALLGPIGSVFGILIGGTVGMMRGAMIGTLVGAGVGTAAGLAVAHCWHTHGDEGAAPKPAPAGS